MWGRGESPWQMVVDAEGEGRGGLRSGGGRRDGKESPRSALVTAQAPEVKFDLS